MPNEGGKVSIFLLLEEAVCDETECEGGREEVSCWGDGILRPVFR